jgi:hypothetical protein
MRSGVIAEIERVENGFEVCVSDPAICKANAKPNGKYQNPEKEYVFPDLNKALKWIKDNADTLCAVPDEDDQSSFTSAWNQATTEKEG